MRLLLDEHFSPTIGEQPRRRGREVVAVAESPALRQQPDGEVLRWAVVERRAVVAENVGDFLRLHADYLSRGRTHWGLILTTRRKFPRSAAAAGRLVAALDELLPVLTAEEALPSGVHWL